MNLSEALDAALPEIPKARLSRSRPPRLDPDLVVRADTLDGEPFFGILQRGKGNYFRFQPAQWQLAQLFDGVRGYEEIAAHFNEETGGELTAKDIELFATNLDEVDFWFKTPQEKNLAYSARLKAQRGRRANRKSKVNLAHISFSAWDPDRYLTSLDRVVGRFIYSRWSVLAVVLLFCFEAVVFVAKWKDFGPDIPLYYNFTHKTFLDFAEFWLLLFGLGFIHESAHGLTCKHYGGEVHSMGLMFLYLTPAFFVDVTESWISATKIQRLATIIAGIWIEMTVCGIAMIVWTNSQPGQFVHDFAYKVILITGLAVIVMNLNPLLKLDGYYFLTELIGIPDLKERSTSFVSGWFQSRVLRLPAEVPSIPRRRVPLFVVYAVVSGAYSYLMLFAVLRFSYNISSKIMAEFALIPVGAAAFVMFRSRIDSLTRVVKEMWRSNVGTAFQLRPQYLWIGAVVLTLLFAPIFRDRENAYFVVEAADPSTLHAVINGRIDAVYVREGERVHPGQALLRLSSTDAAALTSSAVAASNSARFQAFEAQLEGQSIGSAAASEEAAARSGSLAQEANASLVVKATEEGTVLTPDPASLLYRHVGAGEAMLTLAATNAASANATGFESVRLFIPAEALRRTEPGAEVALAPPGQFSILRMKLPPIDGEAVSLPAGLMEHQDYKGIALPTFYTGRLLLPAHAPSLPLGMGGNAKIFGPRRSLFMRVADVAMSTVRAHIW